jgi:preprotein translocase subunit SecY
MINILASFSRFLPEIKVPDKPVPTREKIMWSVLALAIFFAMYHVTAYGVRVPASGADFLQVITASRVGSLVTVGIGPIVMASIFLQLFKSAGLFDLDMSDPAQRRKFHEAQKVFAFVLAILEAIAFVVPSMGSANSILMIPGSMPLAALVVAQIALGAIILFYLDEVVTKYGIGSGISLFIAANVSLAIFSGLVNILIGSNGFVASIVEGGAYALPSAMIALLPFVFTLIVFMVVVYTEGMKVEIPVSYASAKGMVPKIPLKFIYVSNLPVIFVSALLFNFQIFMPQAIGLISGANIVYGGHNIAEYLGVVNPSTQRMQDGLFYLITPIYAASGTIEHFNMLTTQTTPIFSIPEWVHAITYLVFMVLACVPFGIFWSEIGGMDAKSVAGQLNSSGMQMPGYRRDPRLMQQVLEKYINPLILVSSMAVGFLAASADLTGALGTGTGILLTVSIFYKLYEDFDKMRVFDLYPQFSRMFS